MIPAVKTIISLNCEGCGRKVIQLKNLTTHVNHFAVVTTETGKIIYFSFGRIFILFLG